MKVYREIEALAKLPGPVHLAIGVFDGVHLGHQQVIREAQNFADSLGGTTAVVTFDPHPMRVLRPEVAPRLLTSTEHKRLILSRLGVQNLLIIDFTTEFAANSAEQFINLLRHACHPLGSISVGREWAFGKGRGGTVETLKLFGERDGFQVHGLDPVRVAGEPVSSTRIRLAVEAGHFDLARQLLGRDYSVLGEVVTGRKLGRKLGFPTANLAVEAEQLPPVGVYAVHAAWNGSLHPGIANLGFRPTVSPDERERTLEVHLFDFEGELYGRQMEVRFEQRLRDEMRLPSLEALKAQIAADCVQAREILGMKEPVSAATTADLAE